MALLKIKVPRLLLTNRYLEVSFYHRYPKLKRIPLSKFLPITHILPLTRTNLIGAKYFLINSRSIFALETEGQILIHPNAPLALLKKRMRCLVKSISIPTS